MERTEREPKLGVGDKVTIVIPPLDRCGSFELRRKFNGKSFYIEHVRTLRGVYLYRLHGVKSRHGVPYTLLRDWLQPVEVK